MTVATKTGILNQTVTFSEPQPKRFFFKTETLPERKHGVVRRENWIVQHKTNMKLQRRETLSLN